MLASTDVVSTNTQPVVEPQMFNQGIEKMHLLVVTANLKSVTVLMN